VLELQPAEQPAPVVPTRPGRVHLVVVMTRAVSPEDGAPPGMVLVSRFWHPSLHRWNENAFESLEHAMHLFVDESGWVLRQQQALDAPHAYELVFEARREDFSRPSTEAILQDVGLTPEDVADLMERVDRENGPGANP
jgi:phenylpropionate dioxygenase-like ring-hydroxylating dioxygenase large terminal subunit